ncbi:MAG: Sporulation protein, partial [Gemmatimonadetes bacterium]|nr:Sporulation protein [Gemmatimonadota bacterium]
MRPLVSRLALALSVALVVAPAAHAQVAPAPAPPTPMPRPANDSLYRRARRMVLDGNGVAGRALVDSLLAAATPETSAYGDALYWRGALAPTLAEAERDYRRVIVEYPLAFYADDALLAIAELEQGRGDRAGALAHLLRFVKEHPASPARGIAALGAARLAFEQRDTRVGCAMIAEARASVAPGDVELTNQIAYYRAQCPATPPATVAKMGSVPTRAATPVDTQTTATKSGVPRVQPEPLPPTPVTAEIARADSAQAKPPARVPVPTPTTRTP